jgi:hypothetical protein
MRAGLRAMLPAVSASGICIPGASLSIRQYFLALSIGGIRVPDSKHRLGLTCVVDLGHFCDRIREQRAAGEIVRGAVRRKT